MSFFKRVKATVTANIDEAISRIENHDSVIEVALEETRDAAARLKVQTARVRGETTRLRREIERQEQDEVRWTERAKRVAKEDEERALTCLKRRDECRAQIRILSQQLTRNRSNEALCSAARSLRDGPCRRCP